jgi:hypothetical protein
MLVVFVSVFCFSSSRNGKSIILLGQFASDFLFHFVYVRAVFVGVDGEFGSVFKKMYNAPHGSILVGGGIVFLESVLHEHSKCQHLGHEVRKRLRV